MKLRNLLKGDLFAFSKSEFRGFIVLMIILVILIALRWHQLKNTRTIEMRVSTIPSALKVIESETEGGETRSGITKPIERPASMEKIDPNTADYYALRNAGLSSLAANNLIKYRERGGSIDEVGEMLKIYGLDTVRFTTIQDNFFIPRKEVQSMAEVETKKPILELNSANPDDLEALPGLGAILATRVIKYRDLLGGYYSVGQLSEVYGLSDSLVAVLSSTLRTDTIFLCKIDLNRASYEQLSHHPYISNFQAKSILKFREIQENPITIKQLIDNYIVSNEEYRKLSPYLK